MIEGNTSYQTQVSSSPAAGTWNGPKKWDDLTADERIERLREETRKWQRISSALLERISTLEGHEHGADGRIMIQLHAANRNQMQAGQGGFDYLK
jgi:hypothetical protein